MFDTLYYRKQSVEAGTLKFLLQFHWYSTREENQLNLNFTLNEFSRYLDKTYSFQ